MNFKKTTIVGTIFIASEFNVCAAKLPGSGEKDAIDTSKS